MKKNIHLISSSLVLFFFLVIFSSYASTAEAASLPQTAGLKKQISVGEITLLTPENIEAQSYLGLSGEKSFTVPQIKADVILISVFSTTCPHCQKEAPNTNKLYKTIEARPDLKGKIKIIGIGTRDTLKDVAKFKEEYEVPFPLFADKNMSIFNQLAATGTPTLIGVKLLEDGTYSILFRKAGSIGDVPWFIDFLLEMAV